MRGPRDTLAQDGGGSGGVWAQMLFGALCMAGLLTACGEEDASARAGGGHDAARTGADSGAPVPDAEAVADAGAGADGSEASEDAGTPQRRGLVINEIVAKSADGSPDWVELLVTGDGPVRLSEFTLVDDNPEHPPAALPDVELQPGEHWVISASADPLPDGAAYLPFGLGKQDALRLAQAGAQIDELSWEDGDAPAGTSFGRLPDGSGVPQPLLPTPGAPNEALPGPRPSDPFVQGRVLRVELLMDDAAWQTIVRDPAAEVYQRAELVFDGVRVAEVGVRAKGNSSLQSVLRMGSQRYSLKVDLDRFVDGQELLGETKLNFNNGFKDPTLIREHLAYGLLRAAGLPVPRTAFVDLWVAGQHLGLYTLVEQIDGGFLDERFPEDPDGDLYKPEPPAGDLRYRGATPADYPNMELKTNEDSSDGSTFVALVEALDRGDMATLEAALDVDATLRHLAADALLVNLDSYLGMGHNYYLYEQSGRMQPLFWDLNEAFGNFTCQCSPTQLVHLTVHDPTCGPRRDRPLAERLLGDPGLRARYDAELQTLLDTVFDPDALAAQIHTTADLIRPWVVADTEKFFTDAEFEQGLEEDVTGQRGELRALGLVRFVRDRAASVREQLAGERASERGGAGACGRDEPPVEHPCGDGVCDAAERANPRLCPRDCEQRPPDYDWCGDGICDALEQAEGSCPADCAP